MDTVGSELAALGIVKGAVIRHISYPEGNPRGIWEARVESAPLYRHHKLYATMTKVPRDHRRQLGEVVTQSAHTVLNFIKTGRWVVQPPSVILQEWIAHYERNT